MIQIKPEEQSILTTMFRMQATLNEKTKPDWLTNPPNYPLAAAVELMEAIADHTPWKWWKAGRYYKERMFMELIDSLHFVMSDILVFNQTDVDQLNQEIMELSALINLNCTRKEYLPYSNYDNTVQIKLEGCFSDLISSTIRGSITLRECADLFSLMSYLGYSIHDVFITYIGKNVLNGFRLDNGYKEGTYIKIWDSVNQYEDNDILQKYLADIVHEITPEQLPEKAKAFLEYTYKTVIQLQN